MCVTSRYTKLLLVVVFKKTVFPSTNWLVVDQEVKLTMLYNFGAFCSVFFGKSTA